MEILLQAERISLNKNEENNSKEVNNNYSSKDKPLTSN